MVDYRANSSRLRRGSSKPHVATEMSRKMPRTQKNAVGFPPTRWSLVGLAGESNDQIRLTALAELLDAYLPALRGFLISGRRLRPDLSDDVLQGFVADKVLAARLVSHANRARGRFRNLLLRSLSNYTNTYLQKHNKGHVDIGALNPEVLAVTEIDHFQKEFDRQWVRRLVFRAISATELECKRKRREDLWEVFRARVVLPALEDMKPLEYSRLVSQFNLCSPRDAINLLATAKRMFTRHLYDAVRDYAGEQSKDVERELAELRFALR